MESHWRCRICGSAELLGTTHAFCPNCSHERDYEELVDTELDAFLAFEAPPEHRFHGSSYRCCGRGWSLQARHCGCCGDRLMAPTAAGLARVPDPDPMTEEPTLEPPSRTTANTAPPWDWAPIDKPSEPPVQPEREEESSSLISRARSLFGGLFRAEAP